MEWIAPSIVVIGVLAILAVVSKMQARVDGLERRLNLLLRHFNIDTAPGSQLSERVRRLADDPARKIEAIKVYRDETRAGLAEAKAAVEAYINGG